VWSSFAYGFELTGDKIFLKRALEMNGGSQLQGAMQGSGFGNLENRFAILALSQRVNYP
jgi:hypothetical protein